MLGSGRLSMQLEKSKLNLGNTSFERPKKIRTKFPSLHHCYKHRGKRMLHVVGWLVVEITDFLSKDFTFCQ